MNDRDVEKNKRALKERPQVPITYYPTEEEYGNPQPEEEGSHLVTPSKEREPTTQLFNSRDNYIKVVRDGEATPISVGTLPLPSFLPSLLLEGKKESKKVRLLTYNGKTWINVSYKMPPGLARDLKLFCIQNGLRLQEAHASIVAWYIGGQFISDFSGSKKNLQKDIQLAEVRELLQGIRDARRNGIRNPIYLHKQLGKAAKKIRLPTDLEEQVRRELGL